MDRDEACDILRANRDGYYDASDEVRQALDIILGDESDAVDVLLGWSLFYEGVTNTYRAYLRAPNKNPDAFDRHLRVVSVRANQSTDDNEGFMSALFCRSELMCAEQEENVFEFWDDCPPFWGMDDDEIRSFITEFAANYNTKITWR